MGVILKKVNYKNKRFSATTDMRNATRPRKRTKIKNKIMKHKIHFQLK